MTSPSPEGIVVTQASLDDWPVIKGWAADEGWDPGESDGACFFTQDPEGFFLGRIDGEPVSAISVVNYGADYAFLGCYLVRPDLRGRGYGLTTWKTALAHAGGRTIGLDGVVAQQGNYRQSGFELAYKTFRFGGVPAAGSRKEAASASPRRRTSTRSRPTTASVTPPTGRASSSTGSPGPGTVPWSESSTGGSPATA